MKHILTMMVAAFAIMFPSVAAAEITMPPHVEGAIVQMGPLDKKTNSTYVYVGENRTYLRLVGCTVAWTTGDQWVMLRGNGQYALIRLEQFQIAMQTMNDWDKGIALLAQHNLICRPALAQKT